MADINGAGVAAGVAGGAPSQTESGKVVPSTVGPGASARHRSGRAVTSATQVPIKMRARRTSNGATVHWIVFGAEDLTGAQSPFPGDINVSTIVRE